MLVSLVGTADVDEVAVVLSDVVVFVVVITLVVVVVYVEVVVVLEVVVVVFVVVLVVEVVEVVAEVVVEVLLVAVVAEVVVEVFVVAVVLVVVMVEAVLVVEVVVLVVELDVVVFAGGGKDTLSPHSSPGAASGAINFFMKSPVAASKRYAAPLFTPALSSSKLPTKTLASDMATEVPNLPRELISGEESFHNNLPVIIP